MSSYSMTNLREIDDDTGGRMPGLQGRFGRKHLDSRDLGVSLWTHEPNRKASAGHRHREQEEAYVVVAGSGRMVVDGDVIELRPWDVVRVAPEAVRAFESGPDGLEIVAVGGPKPEGGDGELVDDPWPDDEG